MAHAACDRPSRRGAGPARRGRLPAAGFGGRPRPLLDSSAGGPVRALGVGASNPPVSLHPLSGKFNAQTTTAVQRAGYCLAVTEQLSILHTQADRYEWARVPGGEPMTIFVASLGVSMPTVTIRRTAVEPARLDVQH